MRISQMAYRRLLLSIVVILLALGCCTAECYQGYIGREINGLNDPKILCCFGRKMLQELKGKSVDTEGKAKPTNLDNPFTFPQTEIQNTSDKPMAKGTSSRSSSNENVVDKHDNRSTKKNEGSNAFLEAADEVANLMRKDYKGADRPKRKPPINNREPKD